jgi:hypothetical protein
MTIEQDLTRAGRTLVAPPDEPVRERARTEARATRPELRPRTARHRHRGFVASAVAIAAALGIAIAIAVSSGHNTEPVGNGNATGSTAPDNPPLETAPLTLTDSAITITVPHAWSVIPWRLNDVVDPRPIHAVANFTPTPTAISPDCLLTGITDQLPADGVVVDLMYFRGTPKAGTPAAADVTLGPPQSSTECFGRSIGVTYRIPGATNGYALAYVLVGPSPTANDLAAATAILRSTTVTGAIPSTGRKPEICRADQISVTLADWNGAVGSLLTLVEVENTASTPCLVAPRPEATLAATGTPAVRAGAFTSQPATPLASPTAPMVLLDPGDRITARLRWANWCQTTTPTLTITLNGISKPTRVALKHYPRCDATTAPTILQIDAFGHRTRR